MTYKSYEEILKVNKDVKWEYHPMRNIRVEGEKSHIPLRFNLTKEQWNEVYKKKSFAGVKITRRIGERFIDTHPLANKVLCTADEDGVFTISEKEINEYRKNNPISLFSADLDKKERN